jgi:hypothetical protein
VTTLVLSTLMAPKLLSSLYGFRIQYKQIGLEPILISIEVRRVRSISDEEVFELDIMLNHDV